MGAVWWMGRSLYTAKPEGKDMVMAQLGVVCVHRWQETVKCMALNQEAVSFLKMCEN